MAVESMVRGIVLVIIIIYYFPESKTVGDVGVLIAFPPSVVLIKDRDIPEREVDG